MKKFKSTLIIMLAVIMLTTLGGCGKKRKIADLQEKIMSYNAQIAEKEDELDRWQSIYNQAKEAYDHSAGFDSYEIEQERSKTKGYMDEARREIAKLKRDIAILENSRNINMRALNKLIN